MAKSESDTTKLKRLIAENTVQTNQIVDTGKLSIVLSRAFSKKISAKRLEELDEISEDLKELEQLLIKELGLKVSTVNVPKGMFKIKSVKFN